MYSLASLCEATYVLKQGPLWCSLRLQLNIGLITANFLKRCWDQTYKISIRQLLVSMCSLYLIFKASDIILCSLTHIINNKPYYLATVHGCSSNSAHYYFNFCSRDGTLIRESNKKADLDLHCQTKPMTSIFKSVVTPMAWRQ